MTLATKNETEISAALEASELMMDAVGILQHHDAVTGTAKQAVADNYNELLFLANAINGEQYNAAVGGIIKGETGLDGVWRQCERLADKGVRGLMTLSRLVRSKAARMSTWRSTILPPLPPDR